MPKLLQINECLNFSTGKIAQQIGEKAMCKGWDSWIIYSGREKTVPSKSITLRSGSYFDACIHYAGQRLFDREGLGSVCSTKSIIKKIDEIHPDIIVLHNIHDHWLNYKILFNYLSSSNTPVVWVQHDCWSFTGGCMYFDMLDCDNWKDACKHCPDKRSIINRSSRNFRLKQDSLSYLKNITFVPVSEWLAGLLKQSVQGDRHIVTIHNGVDTGIFKPVEIKKERGSKYNILGVAAVWDARKGLSDFLKLHSILPKDEFSITLVGLNKKQIRSLPEGIVGIERTQNVEELAYLYSKADVFINPTYSDNFPTTNIESLASGTPVITYNTGGSPEAVDEETGRVIAQGDMESLVKEIYSMQKTPLSSEACRDRAVSLFDKNKCYEKHINLYSSLI